MGEERYNGNKDMEQLVKGISSRIKGLRLEDVSYDYAFGLTLHFENELMVNIYNTAIFGQEDGCKIVLEQMVDMDTESEHLVVIAEAED